MSIKVENIKVAGWEPSIVGMRNPMNSWSKSDTVYQQDGTAILGPNDLDLMKRLYAGGPVHRKYLRQLAVWVDIDAPLYWWKEFDTYKVGTTADSCSTMHKIHSKELTLDDFSHEHLEERSLKVLCDVIDEINYWRNKYLNTPDDQAELKKHYWWQMIQLLGSNYNQRRTISMNYEIAYNIENWRANHKQNEWCILVAMFNLYLPYFREIKSNVEELKPKEYYEDILKKYEMSIHK